MNMKTFRLLSSSKFFFPFFRPEEVQSIVSGKLALKHNGADIEAMKLVAQASKNRSLADFQTVVNEFMV